MNAARNATVIKLPRPLLTGERSLEQVLKARRSVREFSGKPLTDEAISQLLWAAQGVTHRDGRRSAPSAGALYPLEFYLLMSTGLFRYDPYVHTLRQCGSADLRAPLCRAAWAQDAITSAPAVFLIAAVYARTAAKYGGRAGRYVHMEAGHAAQNLLLQAAALDLAGVPIGAFDDDDVSKVLDLPADEAPLYLVPVGHPR
jgi:SagB-type dehydrogenase family enzyme